MDDRLDDGSRVAICVPPASPRVAITVQCFGKRSFSPDDLVRCGSLPFEVLTEASRVLQGRRNILVSGGTRSGKTTLLNALIELLPDDERIVSLKDTLAGLIPRHQRIFDPHLATSLTAMSRPSSILRVVRIVEHN